MVKTKRPLSERLRDWPLLIVLMTVTSKWMLEGIIGQPLLELAGLMVALVFMIILHGAIRIKMNSMIWLVYLFSIGINVLMKGRTFNILGRALMFFIVVWFAVTYDMREFNAQRIIRFITKIGIFHSLMVLMHLILQERFNKLYFPLLTATSREYAQAYYRGGRYFGILTSPHDTAGLIAFALFSVLLSLFVQKKRSAPGILLLMFLAAMLLLTGKKGVMLCAVAGIVLTMMVVYASSRQWARIGKIIVILVLLVCIFRILLDLFPHNPLFYRITTYMERIENGDSADSGRGDLYKIALKLWNENKLFGVGWKRFKNLSTARFHLPSAHEVNLDYLQWLCEMGVVGLFLNLIPVLTMLRRTIIVSRTGIRQIQNPTARWMLLFAVCIQIFTLCYAFFEVPFYDLIFFTVYIISCIMINSTYKQLRRGGIFAADRINIPIRFA